MNEKQEPQGQASPSAEGSATILLRWHDPPRSECNTDDAIACRKEEQALLLNRASSTSKMDVISAQQRLIEEQTKQINQIRNTILTHKRTTVALFDELGQTQMLGASIEREKQILKEEIEFLSSLVFSKLPETLTRPVQQSTVLLPPPPQGGRLDNTSMIQQAGSTSPRPRNENNHHRTSSENDDTRSVSMAALSSSFNELGPVGSMSAKKEDEEDEGRFPAIICRTPQPPRNSTIGSSYAIARRERQEIFSRMAAVIPDSIVLTPETRKERRFDFKNSPGGAACTSHTSGDDDDFDGLLRDDGTSKYFPKKMMGEVVRRCKSL